MLNLHVNMVLRHLLGYLTKKIIIIGQRAALGIFTNKTTKQSNSYEVVGSFFGHCEIREDLLTAQVSIIIVSLISALPRAM